MNVLIRFEDRYGCRILFEEVSELYDPIKGNTEGGLSDAGVFLMSNIDINLYDRVVMVFDLDSNKDASLIGDELKDRMSEFILDENTLKLNSDYKDKIILIPIFICYETLYLYANIIRQLIDNIHLYKDTRSVKLIKAYKKYYNYSKLTPEYTTGLADNLQDIQSDMERITGNIGNTDLRTQGFHKTYGKQALITKFKDIIYEHKLGEKLADKHEYELFKTLDAHGRKDSLIQDIVFGMDIMAKHNKRFLRLLTCQDISELDDLILTDSLLDDLCTELDEYNKLIRMKMTLQDLQADIANQNNSLGIVHK